MPYDAFISYSHSADGRLAPAIQKALQRLAKPWYRVRALRVFRDETSLSAEYDLTDAIKRALSVSRYFIYLASPEAAKSEWVGREVDLWKSRQMPRNLLIVVTDGILQWDDQRKDFDWERSNCLHPNLRGLFKAVPLWVDVSWAKKDEHFSPRNPRFQEAIARIAAPIHGKPLEEMIGDDVRQHRLTQILVRTVVSVLILLFTFSTVATVVATESNRRLDRKITLFNYVFPAFNSRDDHSARSEQPVFERLWSDTRRLVLRPDDGEELVSWGAKQRALGPECNTEFDTPEQRAAECPTSSAAFDGDGLRKDIPGLRGISRALAVAIGDGSLLRLIGKDDTGQKRDHRYQSVLEHAAIVIPYERRKRLVERGIANSTAEGDQSFLGYAEGSPDAFGRHFQIWRRMLDGAELIAVHVVHGGHSGSGGDRNPTFFILRIGAGYRLVLVEVEADQFAVYDAGPGLMPQIFAIEIKQSGAGQQFRRVRRYDFDSECTCYEAYMSGEIGSSHRNYFSAVPGQLD